jgi:antitoxin component of RelBE/YafQ-DinJ toxin-antitoxin module
MLLYLTFDSMDRDYRLQVRLNNYEREKLSQYAASVGLTMSEAVRELIRGASPNVNFQ